jgi:hypothetical protein
MFLLVLTVYLYVVVCSLPYLCCNKVEGRKSWEEGVCFLCKSLAGPEI